MTQKPRTGNNFQRNQLGKIPGRRPDTQPGLQSDRVLGARSRRSRKTHKRHWELDWQNLKLKFAHRRRRSRHEPRDKRPGVGSRRRGTARLGAPRGGQDRAGRGRGKGAATAKAAYYDEKGSYTRDRKRSTTPLRPNSSEYKQGYTADSGSHCEPSKN